jgi:hypothetical protein
MGSHVAGKVHIYYFDLALSKEDVAFVVESLEIAGPYEQVRIPHVLPAGPPKWDEQTLLKHQGLLSAALRNAGIATDRGKQVILAAPGQMYWYSVLLHAVYAETGAFPWLVQTREQRDVIGNPGETRILDTHALMGL